MMVRAEGPQLGESNSDYNQWEGNTRLERQPSKKKLRGDQREGIPC